MIQVIMTEERRVDPKVDELGRDRCGYAPTMSPLAAFDANRGTWTIGPEAAARERYAVFVYQGIGIQAIEIRSVSRTPLGKAVFNGEILEPGHPVHDTYVGKTAPKPNMRNPVTYFESPLDDGAPCRCGCGLFATHGKPFIQGHDQTALHDRVRRIGTVAEFMDWFDRLVGPLDRNHLTDISTAS
jgi:hypothetical protein